mgnify:FL=1
MSARELTRLTVEPGPDGVLALAAELPMAISGEGPALAPLPAGPPDYVDRIVAAVRPDDPSAPLEHNDVAVVVATSGSMGEPRGVLLSGSALIASAKASDSRLGGPSRWVMALPAHHVAGLQVLVRAHLSGIPPIPLDSVGGAGHFSAVEFANATRAARAIADSDGAQLRTALVPTQLARIVELGPSASDALTAYDTILIGGAAAAHAPIARATRRGPRTATTAGGTGPAAGRTPPRNRLAGVAVRVSDTDADGIGRIELSGPTVARGYRLRPDLTATGFGPALHRTSDRGKIDKDNRLVVVGRIDDVVQVGGINVSVAAVEAAVQEHAMVAEAAVVATDDDQWGSKVTAFVVATDADSLPATQLGASIVERVANALGAESRPRDVVIMSSLPTLPTGKVDREQLRTIAAAR